jgi:hypothetical protein
LPDKSAHLVGHDALIEGARTTSRIIECRLSWQWATTKGSVPQLLNGRRMRATIPSCDQIGPERPLRLSVAAALALPDGTITTPRPRRDIAGGRLIIELTRSRQRLGGRPYVHVEHIHVHDNVRPNAADEL